MKFYLAHPALSKKKIRKWQLKMEERYGLEMVNPFFEGSPIEKDMIENIPYVNGCPPKLPFKQCQIIVQNDIDLVQELDGVIAIIDGATSYGTIMEMCYAFNRGKPVYLICTNGQHEHSWLRYHTTEIFQTFKKFESFVKRGGLKR